VSAADEPEHADDPGEPLGASTLIGYERGQWVVYLEIAYANEVRRHRIQAFISESRARAAADVILRTAMRDHPFRSEGR
jgi:hypothetical protein